MNNHSMFCRVGAALILSSTLVGLAVLPALSQLQREEAEDGTAFLFDGADCSTSGSHSQSETVRAKPDTRVPINHQIYDLLFRMQATNPNTVTLSCRAKKKITPAGKVIFPYSMIDLEMGIPDTSLKDRVGVKVDIYQGGSLRYSYDNLRPGSMLHVPLSLINPTDPKAEHNTNSFSIEMSCNSSSWCYLDFVTAKLYPGSSYVKSGGAGSTGVAPSTSETPTPAPGASRKDAPPPSAPQQNGSGSQLGGQVVEPIIKGVLQRIFK